MKASPAQQATDARLPIYQQLRDSFARKIRCSEWGADHAIPSELDLAAEYRVAPGTVRKAIESLVDEGFLVRHQGKGTFVKRANFGSALFRFFRHTDKQGQPLRPTARILKVHQASPTGTERARLALKSGQQVIRIRRIRLIDDEPHLFEEISVPAQRCAALLDADWSQLGDLLYPVYESLCTIRVHSATETITFGVATQQVSRLLQTAVREPLARIERLAYGIDGDPVEWRRSCGLASRFSYSIELR